MADAVVNSGEVLEGNDWFLTYRLVRADGVYVTRTDVTAGDDNWLTVTAYDLSTKAAVSDRAAYTAAFSGSVANFLPLNDVSESPLTDGFWGGVDDTGYNFFYKVPYGSWMEGGNRYRIEFNLVLNNATTDSAHGSVSYGSVCWASIIYVKPMTSIG